MTLGTGARLIASGALLAATLAACGGSSATGTTSATGATPTPTVAGPAARTISGTVTYSGSVSPTHQIIVVAVRSGEQSPAYSAVIAQPGAYSFSGVTDGTYAVSAFMDLGDDMGPPGANEPAGVYDSNGDGTADAVTMQSGTGLTGIAITLKDK